MTIEERLMHAFQTTDRSDPSPDLWSRVVHSIDEDRQHRRRVRITASSILISALVLIAIAFAARSDGQWGSYIHRPTLEILEVVALIVLVVTLGPAIRRFGRGYARDLWPHAEHTADGLLRLLDVAYYLVFTGFILLSTQFHFDDGPNATLLAEQISMATARIGGLLLVMGMLHASTFVLLPFVALIDNSTRFNRKLPRWMFWFGVFVAVQVLPVVPVLIAIGLSAG